MIEFLMRQERGIPLMWTFDLLQKNFLSKHLDLNLKFCVIGSIVRH